MSHKTYGDLKSPFYLENEMKRNSVTEYSLKKGSNYLQLPVIYVLQMKELFEETTLIHGSNEMLPESSGYSVNENMLLEKEGVKGKLHCKLESK